MLRRQGRAAPTLMRYPEPGTENERGRVAELQQRLGRHCQRKTGLS